MGDIAETKPTGRVTAAGIGFALAGGGCLLTAASIVLAITDTSREDRAFALTAQLLCAALPVALGLFRLRRRRDDRFARLLIGAGLGWSLVTLAQSTDGTLYSVGRTGAWAFEVVIIYLLLAFPEGRLHSRAERRLFGGAILLIGVLYIPTALMAEFPLPSPYSSCGTDCPHNALIVGGGAQAVADVMRALREVLSVLLSAGVAAVLIARIRRGTPLVARVLLPVAVIAAFRTLALGVYDVLRSTDRAGTALDVVGAIFLMSLALVTISFAIGLLGRRLFVAEALQRLTGSLRPHASAAELRLALADALQDRTLEVVYWLGRERAQWVDETGWPVKPPSGGPGRGVTEVKVQGR